MRFKKGGKIEVLKKREMGLGWCPAEIVSGNGHTYYVHYERSTCEDGQPIIERAPRKAIRPCPPLVGGTENWVPGDVVEVFDDDSWKTAKILKVVQAGLCFFVRLLGFSHEFRAYASNVRVRQSWVDNQWIIIGKVMSSDTILNFTAFISIITFIFITCLSASYWKYLYQCRISSQLLLS